MLFIDLCLDLFLCISHNIFTISLKGDLELTLSKNWPWTLIWTYVLHPTVETVRELVWQQEAIGGSFPPTPQTLW